MSAARLREAARVLRERAGSATEGPWAAWTDQDGQPHMHFLLMVGNADAVIPDGEAWIEDVDVNPVAHCYTPEDRAYISTANPVVGLALADWLDAEAGTETLRGLDPHSGPAALAVADAILGESS
mgnify:CR=1 FL=1